MRYIKILIIAIIGLFKCNYGYTYDFQAEGYYFEIIPGTSEVFIHPANGKTQARYTGDITIPETVKDFYEKVYTVVGIGEYAFAGSSITSISLPQTIRFIDEAAFMQCKSLKSLDLPNNLKSIGRAFISNSGITHIKIPNSVTEIANSAFGPDVNSAGCQLESVDLSELSSSITELPEKMFWTCKLKSIDIPATITTIGKEAFMSCDKLEIIKMPNSVISIKEQAFYGCSNMVSLTIPNSVSSIGNYAFGGCNSLNEVISEIKEPFSISENVFYGISLNAKLQVPRETKMKYESFTGWTKYFKEISESTTITTYSLSIRAMGNGSATYDDNTIKNNTQVFTINEGTSATIKFTPDNGYRIKSVKVNNSDVTSNVSNSKYTVSSVSGDTTVEVEFEAIPPTTYTLTIKATGNGSASYDGTTIKDNTSTFTINEGTSATITFTPDTGYRIKSVKLNGTDVTSSVVNSQYTISKINSDNTLAVEFVAIPPMTYTLTIAATGNGSATCNGTIVREGTSTFTMTEGTSTMITFSPDYGYYLSSLKLNNIDVRAGVSNNQYVVANISENTTLDVTFEEMSPIQIDIDGLSYYIYLARKTAEVYGKTKSSLFGSSVRLSIPSSIIYDGVTYNVVSIRSNAFYMDTSFGSVEIPNSITHIGSSAFEHSALQIIKIPQSVTSIDLEAFRYCSYLRCVKSEIVEPYAINENVFERYNHLYDRKLQVPTNTKSKYESLEGWTKYTDEVTETGNIFELKITASGKGYAKYGVRNIDNIYNGTKYFDVVGGEAVVINFKPDDGYRIKSVKANSIDVTSNVANNQYILSSVDKNTSVEVTFEAIPTTTYTMSITATGNGSATYDGASVRGETSTFTIEEGTSATISFTPDNGYRIKSVTLNSTDVTSSVANNQYTISNIKSDNTLAVEFEAIPPTTYTLSITASGNGTATYTGTEVRDNTTSFTVTEGTSATITFTPDAGYRIASVKLNDSDVTSSVSNNQYTISNITANTALAVTFETIPPVTYTLSITASGNGTATYNSTEVRDKTTSFTVTEGTSATITFAPDAGYRITSVKLNGTDVTSSVSNNQYTISNIIADVTLFVTFEAITHTLTITSSGNGSAFYNNTTVRNKTEVFTINEGTSATVTFTPDAGYRIASVKQNDTDVTASVMNSKYTISNIAANTTLAVTFEAIPPTTYTLSITASGNGNASYNSTEVRDKTTSFTVTEGTSATITFTPDAGYRIASVKLNDSDVTSSVSNNQYTISNITANTTLAVTFETIPPTTYTLSITASGNGTATYTGTEVRDNTTSFTVTEGTSATITFTPDAGYRIASVKLNNTDVTASVANNKYTISNIAANTTLAVTFEAIPPTTYTFSITATGNGCATYNGTEVRGKSTSFTVTEGTSATVTFTPDAGYRIKSVKLNSIDITGNVVNSQYIINKISANTTLEVEFEIISYTLSIKATGNGVATYNDNGVRDKTTTFTINHGTSATVTFKPDTGYRIASVKVNDTDVTSSVADNKYTISNITANTTLEVEFVEVITDLAYDGVNYKVVSYDDKTVNVASGNYGLTLTVPATFEAKDKTWTVTGIDSDALANATELAAVIWEPEVIFNNEVSNPNLLLYVKDAQYAPSDIQNVIVGDQAENIVLKDAANGNNFYCPKAFTAKRISYEHHYNMTTGYNTCQGWETIALPFDVTTVLNQKGVDLVPYASWQQGSSQRPFWLYQMTSNGWQAATAIQSNTPYIISMPNNVVYQPSYIQTGYIQFLGSNVEVKTSSQLNESQYGKRHFYVSYQQQPEISDIYALNVNNQWSSNTDVSQAEGSAFIRNSRPVHPFEAYMTIEGSNAPWMIPVFDNNMPTNIVEIERMRNVGNEDWYDLQGRKLQGEPKQDGIYIRNGKKIKK